jgi:hypothetical protein
MRALIVAFVDRATGSLPALVRDHETSREPTGSVTDPTGFERAYPSLEQVAIRRIS